MLGLYAIRLPNTCINVKNFQKTRISEVGRMGVKVIILLAVCLTGLVVGKFTDKCLHCICNVESHCNAKTGCVQDGGSLSCGPYQIKKPYWIDCGKPGAGWKACAKDKACAEKCVRAYMKSYGEYCTEGRTPTCEDYARIHNGGPQGCRYSGTVGYWNKVKSCCGGQNGCSTSTSGVLTDSCLRCMFLAESSGNVDIGCVWDAGSFSCGPYQIKEVYWNECGRPGASWKSCASDKACSERCVRGYMQSYGSRCTGGRPLTCQDYARIHNGGPRGCTKPTTVTYWNKISRCCGGPNGCN